MKKIKIGVIFFAAIATYFACGLSDPKYIDYAEANKTAAPSDPCTTTALASFTAKIEPVIDSTCATSGCHPGASPGAMPLKKSDSAGNRTLFLASQKFGSPRSAATFAAYLVGGHSGKATAGALTSALLQDWLTEEVKCTK